MVFYQQFTQQSIITITIGNAMKSIIQCVCVIHYSHLFLSVPLAAVPPESCSRQLCTSLAHFYPALYNLFWGTNFYSVSVSRLHAHSGVGLLPILSGITIKVVTSHSHCLIVLYLSEQLLG